MIAQAHRFMTRLGLALCVACAVAALALPYIFAPAVRIVYNASDSLPSGWYRIEPAAELRVGSIVLARPPADVAALAARRGYLPLRVPLLKPIAALASQQVCMRGRRLSINGDAVATALPADTRYRPLPLWQQCRRLRQGEVFLLSTSNPASFDSRYFGPVAASEVLGIAQPLWTWSSP